MSKKNSPNRRRSIATLGHGHVKGTSHRRRAYSIAPGERISPAAKARRLLVSTLVYIAKGNKAQSYEHERRVESYNLKTRVT